VQGFCDEVWWSRFAQPKLSSWVDPDQPLRLVEKTKAKADPDPKALACYGLLLRWKQENGQTDEKILLRFVDGRPISDISKKVCGWIREHNRQVKREGHGVRILACRLPVKSPWLNPIEPIWAHGKRRVVEPNGVLSADELAGRICAALGCEHQAHLSIPENVP
jgi:hypothetical protein